METKAILNFDSVMQRLKKAMGNPKLGKMLGDIGLGERQYYNLKKDNQVPIAYIVDWCLRNKISIDWVLFGDVQEIGTDEPIADGFLKIPYYPDIKASAGGGCINGECALKNIKYITVDATSIPDTANKERLFAVKAVGESMADNIKDGAILICDGSDKEFEHGKIFILNSYGETLVKRLFRSKKDEAVILRSDNPFYGEDEVPLSAVDIVAKVVRFYNGANV